MHPSPFLREVLAGGGSTAIVSAFLNPVDVIKTRRQLFAYRELSALEVARKLSQEGRGGIVALWAPGLSATIARELVYSGCTKGVYPIARGFIAGDREPTLLQRVAAASATGFTGSIGANTFDVVKIRQFDAPARYEGGLLSAMRAIAREEGLVAGLLDSRELALLFVGHREWVIRAVARVLVFLCESFRGHRRRCELEQSRHIQGLEVAR